MSTVITVPRLNPNDSEVEITHWYLTDGEEVKKGQPLCDLATTKASYTIDAPESGVVHLVYKTGARVHVGDELAAIGESVEAARSRIKTKFHVAKPGVGPVFSRKAAEQIKRLGLAESDFKDQTFVTEKDVNGRASGGKPGSVSLVKETEIALLKTGAAGLRSSLTIRMAADPLLFKAESEGVSLQALMAWGTTQALSQNPRFLSTYLETNAKPQFDIGYAIDLGSGTRSFLAANSISWSPSKWHEQITEWSLNLARNQVELGVLGSGRFTITDLAAENIFSFEPLLVANQSAILGIGGDFTMIPKVVTLTLAFDHRVHNGREASRFLNSIRDKLIERSGA